MTAIIPPNTPATRTELLSTHHSASREAISVTHLSKTYPVAFRRLRRFFRRPAKDPVEALKDVSFSVERGEIFGLIGRNGAGKTTLTKILATLVQPSGGKVTILGHDSVLDDERVRGSVGLATAEERSFYWRLNAEQNLMFFARLHGLSDRVAKSRIAQLFEQLELQEVARRRFGELSTGNKQRLAVARALLAEPPVLLLDEPTRSLDPLAAERMREMIKSLSRQDKPVTILFTSHNLAEVETLCRRVAIISRGRIRAIDTPFNLRRLTSGRETVRITLTGVESENFLGDGFENLDFERLDENKVRLMLSREPHDSRLDELIRKLQAADATISDIETERPTLLDVLETYEND